MLAASSGPRARLGIALDDVGVDERSLALMPFVAPDVIKLDLRLVQDRPTPRSRRSSTPSTRRPSAPARAARRGHRDRGAPRGRPRPGRDARPGLALRPPGRARRDRLAAGAPIAAARAPRRSPPCSPVRAVAGERARRAAARQAPAARALAPPRAQAPRWARAPSSSPPSRRRAHFTPRRRRALRALARAPPSSAPSASASSAEPARACAAPTLDADDALRGRVERRR